MTGLPKDLPAGFRDSSWHNDESPSITSDALGVLIWCTDDSGYIVEGLDSEGCVYPESVILFTAETWDSVVDFLDDIATGATVDTAAQGARMRLNQLTVADARAFLAAEFAHMEKGGAGCPDLIAHMQAIIAQGDS